MRDDGESSCSAEGCSVLIPFPESCVWLWAHSHHYSSASHVYDTGESNIIQKSISNVPLILSDVLGKRSHIPEPGSGYFLRPLFSHCPLWSVGPLGSALPGLLHGDCAPALLPVWEACLPGTTAACFTDSGLTWSFYHGRGSSELLRSQSYFLFCI